MAKLPITQDHPDVTEPNDWFFDDGHVAILMTIEGDVAVLHDVFAIDPEQREGRSGVGRRALGLLREGFREIVASGVGDPYGDDTEDSRPDYAVQPAFLFWRQMLREGLIDRIDFMICRTQMTRDDLTRQVRTGFCTIDPVPEDLAAALAGP
jgi:hypothetical protein